MDLEDNIYHLYKPLRNYLRQFELMDSLGVIRAYLQYRQFNQAFPSDVQVDALFFEAKSMLESGVYDWQLETLAREIILNADANPKSKTLRHWINFSTALNKLKDLENSISGHYRDIMKENVLLEIHRLSHRQFPWQSPPSLVLVTRYFKIFSHPKIDSIIQKNMGLTVKELYTIGLVLAGVYIKFFALTYPPKLEILGIDQNKVDNFFRHFSVDMESIKELIKNSQLYNQDYPYALSPLRITPLIRTIHNGKDSFIAPVPTFLLKRFTDGVYYELYKDPDFAHSFGESFQEYVGEVINKANKNSKYKYFTETEYYIGKIRKHTTDWVVIDESANLFVECKTKKLRADAKVAIIDNSALEEDLDLMADFIVQVYKQIIDYRNNHYTSIKSNGRPTFHLIVTLEEWFAFGDKIILVIDEKVRKKLTDKSMDTNILEKEPYTICSTHDFEALMQILDSIEIQEFMSQKTTGEYRLWPLASFMNNKFNKEYTECESLFPEDYKEIHTAI